MIINYYPHHIGDYKAATAHLSDLEDLAYRRLLEMYYDTEQPIPVDTQWVSRRLRMGSDVVENVLRDFFLLTETGYSHARCELEIREYNIKAERSRLNGAKGGRRKASVNAGKNPAGSQQGPRANLAATQSLANHEPLTINHKPSNSRFGDFWNAWPTSERKQDKAKCAAKWKAEKLDGLTDLILSDIAVKRRTEKWQGGYIEAPLVYLNNRRWEDGVQPQSDAPAGLSDPDSRAAIESEGVAMGIGPWSEITEQWPSYKARVRSKSVPALNIAQLADMAKRRIA